MIPRKSIWIPAVAVFGVALGAVYEWASAAPPTLPPPRSAAVYGASPPPFRQLASSSCGASACHGGGEVGRKGSEHSTWSPDLLAGVTDPHSRAFAVLSGDESQRMAKALGLGNPTRAALCLKCHAVSGIASERDLAEGVGCGGCHGPAEKWLAAHVEPGWKGLANRDKWDRYGFLPGGNLVARNLACAKCHVGDAEREVSHDLIAAGHPRLTFESARFHFHPKYRKHWSEKVGRPDFEMRTWFVGQVVGLRAAADLLRVRAERAGGERAGPWPEFAGSSCYSCHKKAGGEASDLAAPKPSKAPSNPGWETWSNFSLGVAVDLRAEFYPGVSLPPPDAVADLRELMEKRVPVSADVAVQAAKAVRQLDGWLAAMQAAEDSGRLPQLDRDLPRRLTGRLAELAAEGEKGRAATSEWEALAVCYLGCAAGYHASGGAAAVPAWAEPLRRLEAELKFPTAKGGVRSDGPSGFGAAEIGRIRKHFRALADATADARSQR